LKSCLAPDPSARLTAFQCLQEMNREYITRENVVASPVQPVIVTSVDKDVYIQVLNIFPVLKRQVMRVVFKGADFYKIKPRIVYLSLYNWIRVVAMSKEMRRDFSLITIMLGCMRYFLMTDHLKKDRLATSYCGETDLKAVRNIRKHITEKSVEKSPKKEVNCASGVLTLLKGRIWIKNPGDLRSRLSNCKSNKWDTNVDQAIFSSIMTELSKKFIVPDPDEVLLVSRVENAGHQFGRPLSEKTTRTTRLVPLVVTV
jgi:hypothetical protein